MVNKMNNKELRQFSEATEQFQEEYDGIEADVDICGEDNDVTESDEPYDVNSIRVDQKMITIFQIEHWISKGVLNLTPEYQRNLVWDEKRKCALIESIMLRIPIPAFYIDEDENGDKSVIDGMQRLSTIHEFLNDRLVLKGLQYLSGCNGKVYTELDSKYKARIEDTALAVNILDVRCPKMVKFDVFRRVNTSGIPLNPQEIRNIMAKPRIRKLLKDMSECEEFKTATKAKVKDVRMGAQELCLRYLTIFYNYDYVNKEFKQYKGLLKMMDSTILLLNTKGEEELQSILDEFKKVMRQCYIILEDLSFCKLDNNKINKSLFTSWAVVLNNLKQEDGIILNKAKYFRDEYVKVLRENSSFYNAITSSTGTRKHIEESMNVVSGILEGKI